MKKIIFLALVAISTVSVADEFYNAYGVLVSNRCNGVNGGFWLYPPYQALPVGSACRLPNGVPGYVGG